MLKKAAAALEIEELRAAALEVEGRGASPIKAFVKPPLPTPEEEGKLREEALAACVANEAQWNEIIEILGPHGLAADTILEVVKKLGYVTKEVLALGDEMAMRKAGIPKLKVTEIKNLCVAVVNDELEAAAYNAQVKRSLSTTVAAAAATPEKKEEVKRSSTGESKTLIVLTSRSLRSLRLLVISSSFNAAGLAQEGCRSAGD